MRQKHRLWRPTPLLCTAALLVLPATASYAQGMQDQRPQLQPSTAQQPPAPAQSGKAAVALTDQQRSKLDMSISQGNVRRMSGVNFPVNAGAAIPASTRLYPVTRAMIDVYPQYRDHRFMVVNDEIIIVEPRRKRIVEVVTVGGGSRAALASAPTVKSKLNLTQQQRDMVRSSVRKSKPVTTGSAAAVDKEIAIGERLPNNVVIERFPDTVYRSVPPMRSYHYVVRDRGIYLVDPRRRIVVDLIE